MIYNLHIFVLIYFTIFLGKADRVYSVRCAQVQLKEIQGEVDFKIH